MDVIEMGMKFDSETVTVEIGDSISEALRVALQNKGLDNRVETGRIFIIDDVTVKEIRAVEITCEVQYEYE